MQKDISIKKIVSELQKLYPDAHCELHYSNPLELLIATVLSAQCTDKQVNKVTASLFKKYKSAKDFISVPVEDLQNDIRSIGFFRSKADYIQSLCRDIIVKFHNEVPQTLAELITLKGVARKTANVVLWNAFGVSEGIAVDTHVKRISKRLGMTKHTDVKKIEQDLMKKIPKKDWGVASHSIIFHGRRRCFARKPDCVNCSLQSICPNSRL